MLRDGEKMFCFYNHVYTRQRAAKSDSQLSEHARGGWALLT